MKSTGHRATSVSYSTTWRNWTEQLINSDVLDIFSCVFSASENYFKHFLQHTWRDDGYSSTPIAVVGRPCSKRSYTLRILLNTLCWILATQSTKLLLLFRDAACWLVALVMLVTNLWPVVQMPSHESVDSNLLSVTLLTPSLLRAGFSVQLIF